MEIFGKQLGGNFNEFSPATKLDQLGTDRESLRGEFE